MITIELTQRQIDDLNQLNHTTVSVPTSEAPFTRNRVKAGGHVCVVTCVAHDDFTGLSTISLMMGSLD